MFSGLGERIKEGRKKSGLDQKGLAEVMGVGVGTISRWERETTRPSHAEMVLLALLFKVNRHWLDSGVGSADIPEEPSPFFSITISEILGAELSPSRRFALNVLRDDIQSLQGKLPEITDDQLAELAGAIRTALTQISK